MNPSIVERLHAIIGLLTSDFAVTLYVILTITYIIGRRMEKYM